MEQKEYARRWYAENRVHRISQIKTWQRQFEDRLARQKEASPCLDCGRFYPHYVMDFDHRDAASKTMNVSKAVKRYSWAKLQEEISKCDLVCANCHRERTAKRSLSSTGRAAAL